MTNIHTAAHTNRMLKPEPCPTHSWHKKLTLLLIRLFSPNSSRSELTVKSPILMGVRSYGDLMSSFRCFYFLRKATSCSSFFMRHHLARAKRYSEGRAPAAQQNNDKVFFLTYVHIRVYAQCVEVIA